MPTNLDQEIISAELISIKSLVLIAHTALKDNASKQSSLIVMYAGFVNDFWLNEYLALPRSNTPSFTCIISAIVNTQIGEEPFFL